ncbi:prolyl oligopeptidase family serine peptidase [Sphingomonas sp. AP4-R1]|uniref:alpha/beta hydrolase n=1 Tax=Sphingomonas sp. AP4-R1 TaxID=2735134 RepID=UPI001493C44F|nr:dienelactone hydrolase family protein [Sphingomonas sp. AP4-R1]QJU59164.1 prolyl oligopeptidase family serine peptidase [Sphingomonas sp. AP4-R1]
MSRRLVLFLHGVGSRGGDLAGLGGLWRERLPDTAFVAPDAPFPFDQGSGGRQWFSVAGVTPDNRAARIVAARGAFDALVSDILEREGFADRLDKVAFVGFSQGSIMALDAIASGRWPVGAVVAFSGRLASPLPIAPGSARICLIHGTADPVMPVAEARAAEAALRAAGAPVSLHIEQGGGHMISAEGIRIAGDFLAG